MSEDEAGTGTPQPVLGVLGGSGIYDIDGLSGASWERVESPFGEPSDELLVGELGGQRAVFLPRHGRGHPLSPSDINYRANIDALKRAGVTDLVSLSAVGSLRQDLSPGTFVLVDQFIDRTFARRKTFFGRGLAAHVSMAEPVCASLGEVIVRGAEEAGLEIVRGGTYLVMEGPQFSTRAESKIYRGWGIDVIGMTNLQEAKLAREAEICYATVAMVTDYDCWHPQHEAVAVDDVVRVLLENADRGKSLVRATAAGLSGRDHPCRTRCATALDNSLITAPEARGPEVFARLDVVAGRLLRAELR